MTATVTQSGDDGQVLVQQGASATADGSSATVEQAGADNVVGIYQGGFVNSTFDEATVRQVSGEENRAHVLQGVYYGASSNGLVELTQEGSSNDALIQQGGDGNVTLLSQTAGSVADVVQSGDGNAIVGVGSDLGGVLLTGQSTGGSTLKVEQFGDGNILFLDQNDGSTATVMQDGMTNTATIIQN